MKRFVILVAAMALATAACGSGSAADSAAPMPEATTAAAVTTAEAGTETAPTASPQPVVAAAMTWDGTTCTYTGPTVVPRGSRLVVTLTNTPDSTSDGRLGAGFILVHVDDGITKDDFDAYKATHGAGDVPPWVDGTGGQLVYPDQVKAGTRLTANSLNDNRFMALCSEAPADGQEMHFGAIIETK